MESDLPRAVSGDRGNYPCAGYEQVALNEVAAATMTYSPNPPPPFPVCPSEFDPQFPIDPALLLIQPVTQLALDSHLNSANTHDPPNIAHSSYDNAHLTAHDPTRMLNKQRQQPGFSVRGQSMALNGQDGQYLFDYAPYDNSVLGAESTCAHSNVGSGSFDVSEFQKDVANLDCMKGSPQTAQKAAPRTDAPSVKRQRHRPIRPTPLSHPSERPVRHSPIRRPPTASPRKRATAKNRPHKVSPAPHSAPANALEPMNSLWGLTNAQPPFVQSPSAGPLPTSVTSAHEPAAPTLIPIQAYGRLSKEYWIFFRTPHAVLDQATGKPGGKQLQACQYIDPATKMRCYRSKCNGLDGEPLIGKGFPINDLEDYLRHLWLHRKVERMLFSDPNTADITVWDDAALDAQKALDDARGIVYPYSP